MVSDIAPELLTSTDSTTALIEVPKLRSDLPYLNAYYRYLGNEELTAIRWLLMGVPNTNITAELNRQSLEPLADHLEDMWRRTNTTDIYLDTAVRCEDLMDKVDCGQERILIELRQWLDDHLGILVPDNKIFSVTREWVAKNKLGHVDHMEPDYFAIGMHRAN